MTYFPSRPAKGELFTMMSTETVGSSTAMPSSASGCSGSQTVVPMSTFGSPASATMSPADADSISTRSSPSKVNSLLIFARSWAEPSSAPCSSTTTPSPTRTTPRSMRPMARRPRYGE